MMSGSDFRNRRGRWALFDGNGEIINFYRNASEAQPVPDATPSL